MLYSGYRPVRGLFALDTTGIVRCKWISLDFLDFVLNRVLNKV